MTPRIDTHRKALIDQVAQKTRSKFKGRSGKIAEIFMRTFYANVPPTDIAQQSADNLYGAAASFWQFAQKRKPGQPKIRIFNPAEDEHGWRTSHTVIEILNDDMPFLVDSVTAELNYQGLTVHLVIHPIVDIERDKSGKLLDCTGAPNGGTAGGKPESFMHFEVNEQTDPATIAHVTAQLERILSDVRASVEDWPKMCDVANEILDDLRAKPPQLPLEDVKEAEAFLEWISDNHFTFLGYREYDHVGSGKNQKLKAAPGALGVLRDDDRSIFERWADNEPLPRDIRAFMRQPQLLMLTKANQRSTVHRRVHMDVVGVKKFNAAGKVVGERMFVGLFTSAAYSRSPINIPLLRQKVANALTRADFPPASHDAKALAHILENYPRDELWQIDANTLFNNAMGILHLQERQHTALFVREDPFQRYLTALVFVPRDRYDTELRRKLAEILEQRFGGTLVAFSPEFSTESVLARILYIIKTGPSGIPAYQIDDIEADLREAARSWSDTLRDALTEAKGESTGLILFERYGDAFSLGYRERHVPQAAVADIEHIDDVRLNGELGLNLYQRPEDADDAVHLKLYHDATSLPLSDVLPMLENAGLKVVGEEPFEISYRYGDGTGAVWIHDFNMQTRSGAGVDLKSVREKFHQTFARVFDGAVGDDGFNKLVLGAGLEWRDVVILHQHNQGIGGASRTGIQNSKGDFLIIWPADMSCAPDDLRPYVNQMGKADVIVGCRRRRVGYNPLMKLNAWLYPRLVAALFGLRLRDVNWICIYRGDMARQLHITQDGIPMLTEILVRLHDLGATFLEVDVDMNKRESGVPTASRFTVMWQTMTGLLLFWQVWRLEKRNPSIDNKI